MGGGNIPKLCIRRHLKYLSVGVFASGAGTPHPVSSCPIPSINYVPVIARRTVTRLSRLRDP
jgi:hypothetical protein